MRFLKLLFFIFCFISASGNMLACFGNGEVSEESGGGPTNWAEHTANTINHLVEKMDQRDRKIVFIVGGTLLFVNTVMRVFDFSARALRKHFFSVRRPRVKYPNEKYYEVDDDPEDVEEAKDELCDKVSEVQYLEKRLISYFKETKKEDKYVIIRLLSNPQKMNEEDWKRLERLVPEECINKFLRSFSSMKKSEMNVKEMLKRFKNQGYV